MRTNTIRASRRKYHIIYKTTCLETGKWYIGMHSTDDLNDGYMGSGQRLLRSIRKHGKDKHITEHIEFLPDRAALGLREAELVNTEMVANQFCMNLCTGGTGVKDRPATKQETRAKLSEASKRTIRTPEWCAKISASNKGKIVDPEIGKRHSEKMKGRVWKQEYIDARTEGQKNSEKFKKRYRPIEIDGVIYEHMKLAVQALGIPGSTIHNRAASNNWLNYRWSDQPEKDPTLVSKRARGVYKKV